MREMPKYLPDDQRRHLGENRPQPDGDGYYHVSPGHLLQRRGNQLVILTADHDVIEIPVEVVDVAIAINGDEIPDAEDEQMPDPANVTDHFDVLRRNVADCYGDPADHADYDGHDPYGGLLAAAEDLLAAIDEANRHP